MPECYACSSWFSLPAQGVFFTLDPILRGKKTNLTITLTSEESYSVLFPIIDILIFNIIVKFNLKILYTVKQDITVLL